MKKPTIAFFGLESWEKAYLTKKLPLYKLVFVDKNLDENTLQNARNAEAIGIFIYSHITPSIIKKLPTLKYIITLSTGFDHVDLDATEHHNIVVSNVPAYGDNTVAEHTFALLLALTRNIIPSIERTRRGNFDLTELRGIDLKGKTIGIVGMGRIGSCTARIAKGFQMNILAFDPFPNQQFARELGFTYAKTLDELLKKSDILSLHAPYTKQTHHLINTKNVLTIKKGGILINTARGGLIQTEALLLGLQKNIFKGIGLDVLEEECFVKEEKQLLTKNFQKTCDYKTILQEHMLIEYNNVLITPHNAFNSEESVQRILDTTVENINAFFKGKPVNVVGKK